MPESFSTNKSKLTRPPLQANFLPRPQLLEQFTGWQSMPLTLISAPTGYGKTTLVTNWLETEDIPHAWISLDKNDDSLTQFLTRFLAAIRSIFPDLLEGALIPTNGSEQPLAQTLANNLINDLGQITADFVLVLDNYQFIQQMAVHDLLSTLLLDLPPSMHLVMVTRYDPPIDLTNLRSQNRVTEIRARDLDFNQAEVNMDAMLQDQ